MKYVISHRICVQELIYYLSSSSIFVFTNNAIEWTLTGVYGPQLELDKLIFLNELNALQHFV
jgi:hypothetical protein